MTTTSTSIVVYDPELAGPEHRALAGFLGGYRRLTRDAYALDLRQFVAFCNERHLGLFEVRRSDIEAYGRELEARGRATATVGRRLCTVTGFYCYAEEQELIAHSPAVHVRRPRIDYESHAIGLDRNEVGALLVAAGLGPVAQHALVGVEGSFREPLLGTGSGLRGNRWCCNPDQGDPLPLDRRLAHHPAERCR
jgi:hypothetical protein